MISFNCPTQIGNGQKYIADAIAGNKICGDGKYTKLCSRWLEEKCEVAKALLTTSCTHAIEMAAMLADIGPGDEVIMPAFTFVSTADAFVLRGAKAVFVDIRPDTMNIDECLIEDAITPQTKAIVPVHYAGVSCEMDKIMDVAGQHALYVIEDAAQAIGSLYKGRACGTFGDFGCLSFHETKNLTMGEGGALLIRDTDNIERAEIIREKGTNRSKFWRGEIDKYTWVEAGSSYLPSDINAAYLWAQIEKYEEINNDRFMTWQRYNEGLRELYMGGYLEQHEIPRHCIHNAHMYYIKTKDRGERDDLIHFLNQNGIHAVFHYIPLHTSPAGRKHGRFNGPDVYTTRESERLLRLPIYHGMKPEDVDEVVMRIDEFYRH